MVQFGKELLSRRDQEWNEYYINYGELKWLIKKAKRQQRKRRESNHPGVPVEKETQIKSGEQEPLLATTTSKPSKKKHKKNNSSLGNILDLMQSSSKDLQYQAEKGEEDDDDEIEFTQTILLPLDRTRRQFQHMTDDGYLAALEFRQALDQEIEKLVLFSLGEEGRLAKTLLELSKQRLQLREQVYQIIWIMSKPLQDLEGSSTSSTRLQDGYVLLQSLTTAYRDFASQILRLVDFLDINVTALRKILKKHDKNFPHFKLSGTYLQAHLNVETKEDLVGSGGLDRERAARLFLQQIYHFGGLSSLIYSLASAFDELHSMEWNLMAVQYQLERQQHHRRSRTAPMLPPSLSTNYGTTLQSPPRPHSKTPRLDNRKDATAVVPPPPPPPPPPAEPSLPGFSRPPRHSRGLSTASLASPLRSLFQKSSSQRWSPTMQSAQSTTAPTTITLAHEPVLDQIYAARNRLKETTQYAQNLAAQALLLEESRVAEEDKTPASEFSASQRISSLLNLASCFLYMTNYYVVAPTVGNYAELLGSSESMSGIIIGMTPNAALLATVLYGWWSNHSYRHAILFAGCSSVLGNVLYALALHYNSLTMVLLGRFFNGFGSARSINRRYIADTFSKADRTAASADFVTSGALGMAAGPAIAFVLGEVPFPLGSTMWSSVTSPGWVMACLWSTFLLLTFLFFREPDRSHWLDPVQEEQEESTFNGRTEPMPSKSLGERIEVTDPKLVDGLQHGLSFDNSDMTGSSTNNNLEDTQTQERPLWKNAAVMNSLWLYFVLKLVLEMLLSSTPTVTKFYFGWQSKKSGLFMMFMALLMFPANLVVARLSQRYEDRELILWALIVMLVSVVGILDYTHDYSVVRYVVSAVGIFISTNSLEGPNMGLLSKTIPTSLSRGIFNSGFLATEAGTLARSVGDVLISGIAGSFGVSMLLNGLFLPMGVLVAVSLFVVRKCYSQLTDAGDEDDDDDTASIASGSVE
jgi:Na+/melibiose symporter-like transporter